MLKGLLVRGTVMKRWRKTLDTGTEVVYYEIDGVLVQRYNPQNQYFAIGEAVEIAVEVSAYVTKQGPRYSLVHHDGHVEGEF